jgi:CheY-like chemotaxis protein
MRSNWRIGMKDRSDVATGGRILIVDDDPVVAGMLGVSLAAAGHEIVEASSGEDALAALAGMSSERLPDLMFLDIEMGMGLDAFETCRRLRAAGATRDLPVIFLSGHDELDDRVPRLAAGGICDRTIEGHGSDFQLRQSAHRQLRQRLAAGDEHACRRRTALRAHSRSGRDNEPWQREVSIRLDVVAALLQ